MEFEEWLAGPDEALELTDDTFTTTLFPVCMACRNSIRQNNRGIELDIVEEERQRLIATRIGIGAVVFCVLLVGALIVYEIVIGRW